MESTQRVLGEGEREVVAGEALDLFTAAGRRTATAATLGEALEAVADAIARAAGAEVVVARVLDEESNELRACAVSASAAVAAELEGSRFPAAELRPGEVDDVAQLPAAVRREAERVGASAALQLPVGPEGEPVGSLELLRAGPPFTAAERRLARFAGAQAALTVRAFGAEAAAGRGRLDGGDLLALAGDALAAGGDEERAAEEIARLARQAAGADAALLWREATHGIELASAAGQPPDDAVYGARAAAAATIAERGRVAVGELSDGSTVATLRLGEPPVGALQLLFPAGSQPPESALATLTTFGVRAAHALRTGARTRQVALELVRSRALLAVVGEAIAQLSLAHTLETAVERVAELLGVERLAIYLHGERGLVAAAARGLAGPHPRLADRLLELVLGRFRGRGVVVTTDAPADARLAGAREAAAEAGIEAAVGIPLHVRNESIGLLAVYPPRGRLLSEHETSLLMALATQLAVAVQNARLHEDAQRMGEDRQRALEAERRLSRQLRALYEISHSFAQSLSLEATLDALARTVVELLDEVDVAVIRMPDERREQLLPRAIHIADERVAAAARAILFRPQPFGTQLVQRLFRDGTPFRLDRASALQLGTYGDALLPFLEQGWTGAVVPIATAVEVFASLSVLSLRPGEPVTDATTEAAEAIGRQAGIALDNARLYQQQKQFADTMQRSLLPRTRPQLEGLELGEAYESSARVEVGGDVYDFLVLEDGRLAVVLGDVTGHGVEATADMAMAKFVFRSLAREHPEPGDFLAAANEVVVGEIASGKFITMAYLAVDGAKGDVVAAAAGHPPPRLVRADGTVQPLEARGLALGIEGGQEYEEVHAPLAPGDAVVVYTDGVVEARRDGEFYGLERLDAILSEQRALPAGKLPLAVLADCRRFAGGELGDDCAVVVIKRTA